VKIAYIINSLDGGGAAQPVADVVGLMREQGHEVCVYALMQKDGLARGRLDAAGIPYEMLGGASRERLAAPLRLLGRLKADRPDLLWTSLTHATLAGQILGRLLHIPVVSWQHNAFLKPANKWMLRQTRDLTRHWVCDSDTVAGWAGLELDLSAAQISVWPLFIADPAAAPAKPWPASGRFRIGSLGRLHPNKRHDVLIRAAALLREREPALYERCEFAIAGDGPERERLQTMVREQGLERFHFDLYQENARAWLAGLHLYVQPSRNEGLCLAVHEAMQAGLPVIATPVGELPRSIKEGRTGHFFEIGNAPALAGWMAKLAGDPRAAWTMGQHAKDWVQRVYGRDAFRAHGLQAMSAALSGIVKGPGIAEQHAQFSVSSSVATAGSSHQETSASLPS
jgi:glycosyltransferase involved in cell wall biosynthesis